MNEVIMRTGVNEKIISFLIQHTVLTLATCFDTVPHCANCFFAYEEEKNLLLFKSKKDTDHIRQGLENKNVSGSILPDKLDSTKIQGIQFNGIFFEPKHELLELLKKTYYKKYPFALAFTGEIWAVELTSIKMTDNTLGFGKKIEWNK